MISLQVITLLVVLALQYSFAATDLTTPELTLTFDNKTSFTYTYTKEAQLPNNGIKNICYQGPWAFYSEPNFALSDKSISVFPPTVTRSCFEIPGNPIYYASVRPIGNLNDITAPSITVYSGTTYTGTEKLVTDAGDNVDFKIKSLVVLNADTVEYFTGPNFTGTSFCIKATDRHCNSAKTLCSIGNIDDIETPLISDSKSIRLDCSNSDKIVEIKYAGKWEEASTAATSAN